MVARNLRAGAAWRAAGLGFGATLKGRSPRGKGLALVPRGRVLEWRRRGQAAGVTGFGRIAQLVEQLTLNQRVPGSSPGAPTNQFNHLAPLSIVIPTNDQRLIPTNSPFLFSLPVAFALPHAAAYR